MTDSLIDLFQPPFWACAALAVTLLAPLTSGALRKLAFLSVNVLFLSLILADAAAYVIASAVLTWMTLKVIERGPIRWLWTTGSMIVVFGLFVFHKLPGYTDASQFASAHHVLTAIGYSYVALRAYELVRAVVDGRHESPSLADTVNYLLPFHMLAAGPIQAYDEYASQPDLPPTPCVPDVLKATERIALGMFKKFVLAHIFSRIFLTGFRTEGWQLILEYHVFFLWLYLDFSAYSDIAVGVGRLMGIATPENFNRPYIARNLIDFWSRWHISLSLFIRRNVFIPIQLTLMRSTHGKWPLAIASIAFTVSFLLVGLWHELSFQFFLYGAMQAAGLVVCNLYKSWLSKKLGARGVKSYLNRRSIQVIAILVTLEYQAISVYIAFAPTGKA